MRETYLDLPSRLEDAFSEIDNDIMIELRNEKEEYAELLQKISDLKQKAPFLTDLLESSGEIRLTAALQKISQKWSFLTDLLESSGEIRLTAKEYAAFTQYLHLVRQRDDMERQQIYFRGHTDAVAYLKKIKAI